MSGSKESWEEIDPAGLGDRREEITDDARDIGPDRMEEEREGVA